MVNVTKNRYDVYVMANWLLDEAAVGTNRHISDHTACLAAIQQDIPG